MKRFLKVLICAAFCFVLLCFPISAEEVSFSLDLGDDYLYFREDDDLSRAAEITGLGVEEIEDVFEQESLVMLVLSEDNKRQIRVACYENEVSEGIGDFASYSYSEIREISDEIIDSFALGGTLLGKGAVENIETPIQRYMVYSELHTDSGGDYAVTQYVTVKDGAFWHITTYAPNHSNIPDVMPYFTVGEEGSSGISRALYIVSAFFAVFAVVMLAVYIRERKKESQIAEISEESEIEE